MENLQKYITLITKNKDFQKLFAARLITLGGDWLLTVPLLGIIYGLTDNPFITSLVLVVQSAPLFLLGSFGGYLADRFDRKKVLAISEFLSGFVVLLILYAVTTENVVFILFSFGMLSVVGFSYMPASDAALPNVVKKENLAEANVLFFSSWGIMAGLGAGLGGYLTTVISRNMLFTIDFLSFLISALIVFSIQKNLSEASIEETRKKEISYKDGVKYASSRKEILSLIITKATFAISASGLLSMFTVLSYDIYQAGDYGTGLMFAARGVGALVGPIVIRYFFGSSDGKLLNTIGLTIMAWGLFYFFIPFTLSLYLTVLFLFLGHSGGGSQWAFSTYGLQVLTPDRLRGRIAGIDYSLYFLMNTISTLMIGYLTSIYGVLFVFKLFPVLGFMFGFVWYLSTRHLWKNLDIS
ncbi:MAG: MFS transporter [Candidatus Actinomarina sp.]|jgi:MFS family permease|tara:strand:+ start:39 stop:1271 length:1233 start_codon:yes stop_codon:yes gene_type:complete